MGSSIWPPATNMDAVGHLVITARAARDEGAPSDLTQVVLGGADVGAELASHPGIPLVSVPVIVLRTATLFPVAITSWTSMCMSGVISRIMLNIAIAPALSAVPPGMGVRSMRYSALIEDGVVKNLDVDESGAIESSACENMLQHV